MRHPGLALPNPGRWVFTAALAMCPAPACPTGSCHRTCCQKERAHECSACPPPHYPTAALLAVHSLITMCLCTNALVLQAARAATSAQPLCTVMATTCPHATWRITGLSWWRRSRSQAQPRCRQAAWRLPWLPRQRLPQALAALAPPPAPLHHSYTQNPKHSSCMDSACALLVLASGLLVLQQQTCPPLTAL